MANIITDNKHYTDIANAIREKSGDTATLLPAEMAAAILNIKTGGGEGKIDSVVGTFSTSGANTVNVTFETPMDVTPDFILFYETTSTYGSQNRTKVGAGSTAMILIDGTTQYFQVMIYGTRSADSLSKYNSSYPITITSGTTGCPVKKATVNGFTACAYSGTYQLKGDYKYIAVSYS